MNNKKAQSSLEFLSIYAFAILIIAIVGIALYNLGIFNPSKVISEETKSKALSVSKELLIADYNNSNSTLTLALIPKEDITLEKVNLYWKNGSLVSSTIVNSPYDAGVLYKVNTDISSLGVGKNEIIAEFCYYKRFGLKLERCYNTTLYINIASAIAKEEEKLWYYSFLGYRTNISIENPNSYNLSNYQLRLIVNYNSNMQSDFDDLRFTYYNRSDSKEYPISYWIEEKYDGINATVWIKIPFLESNVNETIYMYYGNNTIGNESNKESTFDYFMEVRNITLPKQSYAGEWFHFDFSKEFKERPIIIAQPDKTYGGGQELRIRLRNITTTGFDARQQEPSNRDDKHAAEDVTFIAIPEGNWETLNGIRIEAGTFTTTNWLAGDSSTGDHWNTVTFSKPFTSTPIVFSQIQNFSYTGFAHTRIRSVTSSSFQTSPEPQGSVTIAPSTQVEIGWIAVERFSGEIEKGVRSEASTYYNCNADVDAGTWCTISFSSSYSKAPNVIAWSPTYNGADSCGVRGSSLTSSNFKVTLEEDTTKDSERGHTSENIDYFVIEDDGIYYLIQYVDSKPIYYFGSEENKN